MRIIQHACDYCKTKYTDDEARGVLYPLLVHTERYLDAAGQMDDFNVVIELCPKCMSKVANLLIKHKSLIEVRKAVPNFDKLMKSLKDRKGNPL